MAATAARRAPSTPSAPPAATPGLLSGEDGRAALPPAARSARLDGLRYDAWLLPPLPPSRAERAVRALSFAAGPSAFVAFALAVGPKMF